MLKRVMSNAQRHRQNPRWNRGGTLAKVVFAMFLNIVSVSATELEQKGADGLWQSGGHVPSGKFKLFSAQKNLGASY